MQIVKNWNKLWKSTTVLLSVALAALSTAQLALASMQASMDPMTFVKLTLAISLAIGALRYVQQQAIAPEEQPPTE